MPLCRSLLSGCGRRCRQVGELLGVAHDINTTNLGVGDLERYHREWLTAVVADGGELAVDAREARHDIRGYELSRCPNQRPRHLPGSLDEHRYRRALAAAVGMQDDVPREQFDEALEVPARRRLQKLFHQALTLLWRGTETRPVVGDVLATPAQELAAVSLTLPENVRDLFILVIENLP